MSEGQMILLFCVVYSGVLSVAIWANLVARQRMQAHLINPEPEAPERRQSA
jgi:hypothetical protein